MRGRAIAKKIMGFFVTSFVIVTINTIPNLATFSILGLLTLALSPLSLRTLATAPAHISFILQKEMLLSTVPSRFAALLLLTF